MPAAAASTEIYVNVTSGTDAPFCGSSAAPCGSLSYGLSLASPRVPTTLYIASGLYSGPQNCNISLSNWTSLAIIGAGPGVDYLSEQGQDLQQQTIFFCANVTALSNQQTPSVSWTSPRIFFLSVVNSSLTLASLSVQQCTASALLATDSTLFVTDVLFARNSVSPTGAVVYSSLGGGAIFIGGGSVAAIHNSSFSDNSAGIDAILTVTVQGGAIFASGAATLSLLNCTFTRNYVAVNSAGTEVIGGAIAATSALSVLLSDCVFTGNFVSGADSVSGGAAVLGSDGITGTQSPVAHPTIINITRCEFTGNYGSGVTLDHTIHRERERHVSLRLVIRVGRCVLGPGGDDRQRRGGHRARCVPCQARAAGGPAPRATSVPAGQRGGADVPACPACKPAGRPPRVSVRNLSRGVVTALCSLGS